MDRHPARDRVLVEDALKLLIEDEQENRAASAFALAKALVLTQEHAEGVLHTLRDGGLLEAGDGPPRLTEAGREYAMQVLRAHRLYEAYLAQRTGLGEAAWHDRAHVVEHRMTPEQVESIADELGHPPYDPHGDPIPTREGALPPRRGRPLSERPAGWTGRIVHVEDEPPEVYRRLALDGFAPDVRLRVEASGAAGLRVRIDGRTVVLPRDAAGQITADTLPAGERFDETVGRLSDLRPGERAEVVGMSPLIRGLSRSRLLDLGVVPGTVLEIDIVSPSGDPVAYRIRGASIALRREQSDRILVRRHAEAAA
ncbi:MAG: metal-dependent transcriptional regulator [Verrucomicrobia bacterium]|nr:metal-dependent transcriptional regulator [Verrucomicrobiota bacterium]